MMTEVGTPLLVLYGALWGASFDSEGTGAITDKVMAYVPYDEEWRRIEQSAVHDARRSASSGGYVPPPLCVVATAASDASETIDDARQRAGSGLIRDLADAVSALRLAKAGWFLDPRHVALTFTIDANDFIQRLPGPYRQAMLGGVVAPMPQYELSIADLGTGQGIGAVCAHAAAIGAYRESGGNTAAEIALAQFNRSFGLSLTNIDRAAMLFTSLDAMFGGMSARRIRKTRLKRYGFRGRIEEALVAAGLPAEEAKAEAAWLDWVEGGRGMRNALAHGDVGRLATGIALEDVLRLQHLVRQTLPGFLAFSVRLAGDRDTYASLDLPADAGVTAAYNRALERKLHDVVAHLEFEWPAE